MGLAFPGGRRFAFTIMDDTDVATLANVGPVYRLLDELGFRTTKTVWPVACPEGSPNFSTSETLEDAAYLDFVLGLKSRGFEIAYHGATMESSTRDRTERALARFRELFGGPPRVYANHALNRENLYWGAERLDDPVLRALVRRAEGQPAGYYQGHVTGYAVVVGRPRGADHLHSEPDLFRHQPPAHQPLDALPGSTTPRGAVVVFRLGCRGCGRVQCADLPGGPGSTGARGRRVHRGDAPREAVHRERGGESRRPAACWSGSRPSRGGSCPSASCSTGFGTSAKGASDLPKSEWRRMQWRWAFDLAVRKWRRRG